MSGASFFRRVWVLMAIVFVDMVGFLVVLPLLPFYAEEFGASESTIGGLIAVFAIAQFATAPLWGKLSDRYGRRPMILLGLGLSAAAYLLFGLAATVLQLLISRLVQGMGAGTIGVVQAYVSDSAAPSQRTQALGWVTVATSAGVMLGPALGSMSTLLSDSAPGFIAAGLCLLNLLFARAFLPESFPGAGPAGPEEGDRQPPPQEPMAVGSGAVPAGVRRSVGRTVQQVLWHPGMPLATLIWVYTFGMMAFMAMNGVVALYLNRVFGVTKETIGYCFVYGGAVSILMRAFVLGVVVRRLGDVRTLRLGCLAIAVGMGLAPVATSLWSLALVIIFVPVGTALLFPATTSLISQHSPPGEVGQNLGVQQSFGGISRAVGPVWATAAFQYLSIESPFWVAGALMVVVLAIALRVPEVGARRVGAEGVAEASTPEGL